MKTPLNIAGFDRNTAFSRSIGLITKQELDLLKGKTVAIAGLGGVGGSYLLTLARLGVGGFHIADMDTFSIENFNRQAGANMNTLGRAKVEVLKEMALAINPELRIKVFSEGVNNQNISEFFLGVDTYVDGLDFFAFRVRESVFRFCYQKKIPATTVGPIGMGAALMNFLPGGMSFDDYFQWKPTDSDLDLSIKLLLGLTPSACHRFYIVDPSALDFEARRGPSLPMGIELCAGVLGTEVLKILLKRGKTFEAPHSILYDAYFNKLFHHYVMFGNRNPLQRLKYFLAKWKMTRLKPKV